MVEIEDKDAVSSPARSKREANYLPKKEWFPTDEQMARELKDKLSDGVIFSGKKIAFNGTVSSISGLGNIINGNLPSDRRGFSADYIDGNILVKQGDTVLKSYKYIRDENTVKDVHENLRSLRQILLDLHSDAFGKKPTPSKREANYLPKKEWFPTDEQMARELKDKLSDGVIFSGKKIAFNGTVSSISGLGNIINGNLPSDRRGFSADYIDGNILVKQGDTVLKSYKYIRDENTVKDVHENLRSLRQILLDLHSDAFGKK